MRRRTAMRALAGGVLAAGLVAAASPAAGAAAVPGKAPDKLTEISASPYSLADNGSFDTFKPWVSGLDGKLTKAPFADVLADGNRQARELCRDTGVTGAKGFCWESGDEKATDWYPQGVTGSWDATDSGEYEGHRAVLASWYHKGDKGSRVSLVNYDDPAKPKYRHILLVEPTSADNFKQVPVHAGGIAWVGDYLYVVDTSKGVRVFDLRHLWKTEPDPSKSKIGKGEDGKYYAYNYAYVLPQVGAYSQEGKGDCDPAPTDLKAPLCFSWVGLDHSGSAPSLVTGEFYYGKATGSRLVNWPLDPSTNLLAAEGGKVAASKAHQTPHYSIQGGVSDNGTYLMASSRGKDSRSVVYRAKAGQSSSDFTVPAGVEDLSYDPADKRAWTLTEYPGNRQVIGIPDAMG